MAQRTFRLTATAAVIIAAEMLICSASSAADTPPVGSFTFISGVSKLSITGYYAFVGAPVVCEADQAGPGFDFAWTFSDGGYETGRQVSHTFISTGTSTVTLTVTAAASQQSASSSRALEVLAFEFPPAALLIMGSGNTGTWNTELLIANPTNFPIDLEVGTIPVPSECTTDPCPPPLNPARIELPASGQLTLQFTDVFGGRELQYLYVLPSNPSLPLPVVRARAYEVAQPARAMELPITSYAALAARQNSPLDFPGAELSSTAHSNLVIAEVGGQYLPAGALIEAITTGGTTVASKNISLATRQTLFLVDILTAMGLKQFSGHLRVTYTGGGGIIDGALATLTSDGGFAVSAGFNP
jgi:PKD repeat protein